MNLVDCPVNKPEIGEISEYALSSGSTGGVYVYTHTVEGKSRQGGKVLFFANVRKSHEMSQKVREINNGQSKTFGISIYLDFQIWLASYF